MGGVRGDPGDWVGGRNGTGIDSMGASAMSYRKVFQFNHTASKK